ncbi:alpha-(1-_3)-arabinofuranosyltransferase family protein [Nocardioides sp. GY 10113]|uniref:alpha-(1->3)-arabinofuranosyltransferase domain-containing protein n=1 Tax=Nocardioides sp. GY 10113 TaxID=2569761 RepID=UPI0014586FF3|nr:alpha-(1->3)-arabinofuranosyltransferase family protein [Nocardioides sp. GY 10113]
MLDGAAAAPTDAAGRAGRPAGARPAERRDVDEAGNRRWRWRLLAASVVCVGLAFVQSPGYLVADTKFDLAQAPLHLLGRAVHLWDAQGAFGQLQNQAYGYLWPMGPFFSVGWLLDLPGWVTQRLWLGLVLAVALVGAARLVRALGVRSDLACLLAGFAYALSPRMLSTLGPISIEAWPSALAPWVLLPLVLGSRAGSPRWAAARSALAIAAVGGVNAAATFAVIPLGALWLLTREPGPRRRALMLWWPLFTLLGTLWWLVPLFVMGAYSPPFLDFIETTSVTTFPTTVFDALRGTSNWVPYVDGDSRAGRDLLSTPYLAVNGGIVLLLGFAGLLDRATPERRFLGLGLVTGLLMVTAGHHGSVVGWFHEDVAALLDGALAPLRNVHKFDPVIRLPLVVGLAFAVDRLLAWPRTTRTDRGNRVVLSGIAVFAVVFAAMPAALGRIAPGGPVVEVPPYWTEAADWLAEHSGASDHAPSTLLVPGAAFGEYFWGTPRDEPMQWLAESPWAVRNVIPLAPAGNIRMLDRIEEAFAEGRGSDGLVSYLRRAGISYLLVRNDLARQDDVPDPVLVHQAIEQSPGLVRVASFGPTVGGGSHLVGADGRRLMANGGWQVDVPAIEVFAVPGVSAAVAAERPTVVAGGPEDLLDLADLDLVGQEPTVLAADLAGEPDGPVVLTDGLRDRERFFPRLHDGYSSVTTPGDVRRNGSPTPDYTLADQDRWATTARLTGAEAISASSSLSDAGTYGGSQPGRLPYAAIDGSAETAWVSGGGADRAWWQIDLGGEREVWSVRITLDAEAPGKEQLRVVTAAGATPAVTLRPGETTVVPLDAELRRTSSVRVENASRLPGAQLRLAEVEVPGVEVRRSLVLPTLPEGWPVPRAVVLRADLDARSGCVEVDADTRCRVGQARTGEEPVAMERVVTMPAASVYNASVRVRPRAGRALDGLLLRGQPVDVQATSAPVPDPRAGAVAAVDGDPGTTWTADPAAVVPTLELAWLDRRRVTGLTLTTDVDAPVRAPTRIEVVWSGGSFELDVDGDRGDRVVGGRVSFPRAIRTDRLRIRVLEADDTVGLGADGQAEPLGYGISEVQVRGVPYFPLALSADETDLGCGSGPTVTIDGVAHDTSVSAAPRALAAGGSADARLCDEDGEPVRRVALVAGENDVRGEASEAFVLDTLVLGDPPARVGTLSVATTATTTGTDGTAGDGDPVRRTLEVPDGIGVVDARTNANAGWEASLDGRPLEPVVVDGWKQGWRVPAAGTLDATYAPDRPYRTGLMVGGACLLALAVLVAVAARRRRGPGAALAPVRARRLGAGTGTVALVAVTGLVAGWPGVLLGAAMVAGTLAAWRRAPQLVPVVVALPCLVGGLAYALFPWGGLGTWAGELAWVHYLALLPVVGVLTCFFEAPDRHPPGRIPFRRRAGRSTTR